MQMLLARLDKQFDRLMAEEENSHGCFTRAYITLAARGVSRVGECEQHFQLNIL